MKLYERNDGVSVILCIILFVILVLVLFGSISCTRKAVPASSDTIISTVVHERIKDTTIYLTDSSYFYAYLWCDSVGEVRVREIEAYYAGRVVEVPKVVVRNNYLKAECKVDSAAVYLAMKLSDTTRYEAISRTIVQERNYLTGWQWAQVWWGRIAAILVALVVSYLIVRRKWPP